MRPCGLGIFPEATEAIYRSKVKRKRFGMRIGIGRTWIYAVAILSACAVVAGCGHSDASAAAAATPTSASKPLARSGAAAMRDKLNAMSVPDRLAYLKQHPEAARQMMGGGGPVGGPGGGGGPQ